MKLSHIIFAVTMGTLFSGCSDKAAPSYAQCVQLDIKGDVGGAWDACSAAINISPTSAAGKQSATKLIEMKSKYDVWKKAYDKAQAKAAAEAKRAEARRIASIRERVYRTDGYQEDECRGRGRGHSYIYTGSTFSENDEVARADGCSRVFSGTAIQDEYCCPE